MSITIKTSENINKMADIKEVKLFASFTIDFVK
jgi:hypothetical protein